MSVASVGNPAGDVGGAALDQARARAAEQRPATATAAKAHLALQPVGNPSATLSARPPEGTDPQLWSVLTTEERAFFSKTAALGPLTYGRIAARNNSGGATGPSDRGARLDVRA